MISAAGMAWTAPSSKRRAISVLKAFTRRQITTKLTNMKTFVPFRIVTYGKESRTSGKAGH